ncbi:MAG: hypothetical protein AAF170_04340 [Bacteroidota bacterium]
MALQFHKVSSLPGTLAADAFYFVEDVANGRAESYVTDSEATARAIGNTAMIQAIADQRVTTALADYNLLEVVADIAARDALAPSRNVTALVSDASADATVASGAALYAYAEGQAQWIKLTEYESLDLSLAWANITGRPTSAPSLIDDAVTKRHNHANQAALDKIGEDGGGNLTYDGSTVGGGGSDWDTLNW